MNPFRKKTVAGAAAAESAAAARLPRLSAPHDMGSLIQTVQMMSAAYGMEDGANVVYTTVAGSASSGAYASFSVIDIDRGRLLGAYPLEATSIVHTHVRTPDGRVVIGGAEEVFVYSPVTKQVANLGKPIEGTQMIWTLACDEQGNVYGGTYSQTDGGRIFRIDAATHEMIDLLGGPVDDGSDPQDDGLPENNVRSLVWYKGFLYAGTGTTNGRVWKIDPATGAKVRIEMPGDPDDPIYEGRYNRLGAVYALTVVGSKLFVFVNGSFSIHVYDMDRQLWEPKAIADVRGHLAVTPAHDGKVYTSKRDKQLWEIDVATLAERPVMPFDDAIRSSAWIEVKGRPGFDGTRLVTVGADGKVTLYDPPNGRSLALDHVVERRPSAIQALETGPDGKLYISCYLGTLGGRYDPESDRLETFPLAQAEGIGFVGDTAYFGVYPKAELYACPIRKPLASGQGPIELFKVGEEQDRPFVVAEGGGKLLLGTIPGYSAHGGALTVYDPAVPGARPQVYRGIIAGQSIVGLLYKDGLIYGSTSIYGGLGAEPIAKSAKLLVWDPVTGSTQHEWTPEPGFAGDCGMISGLTPGPDGLVWAALNGGAFAFDPHSREIVKAVELYPETGAYGRWRPVHQRWGADGLLYTDLGGTLSVIDPETLAHRKLLDNVQLFTLDKANRIYVACGARITRYEPVRD